MELNGGSRASKWNDFYFAADTTERLNYHTENKVICTFVLPKNCQEPEVDLIEEGSG